MTILTSQIVLDTGGSGKSPCSIPAFTNNRVYKKIWVNNKRLRENLSTRNFNPNLHNAWLDNQTPWLCKKISQAKFYFYK